MDEYSHRRPLAARRCLMAVALLLLALAGCKQLEKLQELGLGKSKEDPLVPPPPIRKAVADTPANAARPAAPAVKLDGSAQTEGSPALPNAPTIGAGSGTEALAAIGDTSKDRGSSPDAGAAESAETNPAGKTASALPEDSDGWEETEGGAKPNKIAHVGGLRDEDEGNPEAAENPAADVISPIEIEGTGAQLKKGQVAALVNGVPIFAEDVMLSMPLEAQKVLEDNEKAVAAGKAPAEMVRKYRQQMIDNFLQQHIQQELLLQAVKATLKADQLNGIQKHLDALYDSEYLPKLLKEKGYASALELERELQKHGTSIEALRTSFRNRQLAQQYLGMKSKNQEGFDVPDIRAFYQEHREDYAIVAKVKWEQIQLKFAKHGGKEKTRKKSDEIVQRLENGELFAVVAKECSDGPTKSNGGLWGWTTRGSVKSKEIDKALFEQPVGEIGAPIETADGIEIVRVIDRTDAGYKKFEDVQEDIRNQLKDAEFKRRVNELIKELIDKASIEKFTDKL